MPCMFHLPNRLASSVPQGNSKCESSSRDIQSVSALQVINVLFDTGFWYGRIFQYLYARVGLTEINGCKGNSPFM